MSYTIKLKSNGTTNIEPVITTLDAGSMAINTADGNLFVRTNSAVVKVASNSTLTVNLPLTGLIFESYFDLGTSNLPLALGSDNYQSVATYPSLINLPAANITINRTALTITSATGYIYAKNLFKVNSNYCCALLAPAGTTSNWFEVSTDLTSWSRNSLVTGAKWLDGIYSSDLDKVVFIDSDYQYNTANSSLVFSAASSFGTLQSINFTCATANSTNLCIMTNGRAVINCQSLADLGVGAPADFSKVSLLPGTVNYNIQDVAWNGSVFCAVAYGTAVAFTSPDGVTWTQRTLPVSTNWQAIAWNGNVFCAIAYNTNIAATSPDGITWTQQTLSNSRAWRSITSNGTTFLIVASNTNISAISTNDGVSWTENAMSATRDWRTVIYAKGIYLASAYVPNSSIGNIATSANGVTWTNRFSHPYGGGYCYYSANFDRFFNSTANFQVFYTSTDGIIWNYTSSFGEFSNSYYTSFYRDIPTGGVICVIPNTRYFYYNVTDASTVFTSAGLGLALSSQAINYSNNVFLVVGNAGYRISTDGVNWSTYSFTGPTAINFSFYRLLGDNNIFLALPVSGNYVLTSVDGSTWTQRTLPVSSTWRNILWDGQQYILSGTNISTFYTSTDGITWQSENLPYTSTWIVGTDNTTFFAFTSSSTPTTTTVTNLNAYQRHKDFNVWLPVYSNNLALNLSYSSIYYIDNSLFLASSYVHVHIISVDYTNKGLQQNTFSDNFRYVLL